MYGGEEKKEEEEEERRRRRRRRRRQRRRRRRKEGGGGGRRAGGTEENLATTALTVGNHCSLYLYFFVVFCCFLSFQGCSRLAMPSGWILRGDSDLVFLTRFLVRFCVAVAPGRPPKCLFSDQISDHIFGRCRPASPKTLFLLRRFLANTFVFECMFGHVLTRLFTLVLSSIVKTANAVYRATGAENTEYSSTGTWERYYSLFTVRNKQMYFRYSKILFTTTSK